MDIAFLIILFIYVIRSSEYKKTDYYKQTKNSYLGVLLDKGKLGEFYIHKDLTRLKGVQKYLFNVYVPKDNGEMTEIDVILIHESGVYVFESKNYSGWIFGSETQQYWTQTLPIGKKKSQKTRFFNPIIQNKVHMKWLRQFLGNEEIPFYSYIVFSNRCELKKIDLISSDHRVINRYNVLSEVRKDIAKIKRHLLQEEIERLYLKLYPCTQKTNMEKLEHIQNIQSKYSIPYSKKKNKNVEDHKND